MGCPQRRCSGEAGCHGKALGKPIRALGVGMPPSRHSIPQRTTSPLPHPLGPCATPSAAPVCCSPLPAPPADRAAIDAQSRLTCSRRSEGAPTMGCLCALAGAEPAAPRLKYKQPGRHLPPLPRSPEGGTRRRSRPQRRGTPQTRRAREWDAAPRRPGRFLPSPPAHPGVLPGAWMGDAAVGVPPVSADVLPSGPPNR